MVRGEMGGEGRRESGGEVGIEEIKEGESEGERGDGVGRGPPTFSTLPLLRSLTLP